MSGGSVSTFSKDHDADRSEQYNHVKGKGVIFYIVKIILQLFRSILDRGAVVITDLRPASYPRFHAVPDGVEGDFPGQLIDKKWPLGAWSDQAHIALQNIEKLRQFIDTQLADDVSDPCHPIIA